MWENVIWACVVLAVSVMVICSINNRIKEFALLRRKQQSLNEDEQRVDLKERDNTARLQAATADERAEHERARLLQETAEARMAAELAENPDLMKARIAEEEEVIAARTEGRALAAKEQAARKVDTPNQMELLLRGYEAWLNSGNAKRVAAYYTTFADWLGDTDLSEITQTSQ